MLHPILDEHDAIAWDMDGTLVDGPNSELFLAYIAATPHKRHHVITFRNKHRHGNVWTELAAHGLNIALIRSVENCPEQVHDCYMLEKRFAGAGERQRHRDGPEMTREEWFTHVERFPKWKGERAAHLGCTILVDDMPHWVLEGCRDYEIDFLHAFEEWPTPAS